MKNILIIDDDKTQFILVKAALTKLLFNSQEYKIYPDIQEQDFIKKIKNYAENDQENELYSYIFEYIEEHEISAIFSDRTFTNKELKSDTVASGEKLISKLLKNKIHKDIVITLYSKSRNDINPEMQKLFQKTIGNVELGTVADVDTYIADFRQDLGGKETYLARLKEFSYRKYHSNYCIVCALTKEYEAVKNIFANEKQNEWKEERKNEQEYEYIYFKNSNNIIQKIYIKSMSDNMGMVEASIKSLEIINYAKPQYLSMTGIAGGVKSQGAALGDICIAKTVDNWQSGKYNSGGRLEITPVNKEHFETLKNIIEKKYVNDKNGRSELENIIIKEYDNKHNYPIKTLIKKERSADKEEIKNLKKLGRTKKTIDRVQNSMRKVNRLPKVVYKSMMTGSSLVADEKIIEKIMRSRDRHVFCFDMEAFAIARVAKFKEIDFIIIKTIVDYGNHLKGDDWHAFGVFSSAYVLRDMIFNHLS